MQEGPSIINPDEREGAPLPEPRKFSEPGTVKEKRERRRQRREKQQPEPQREPAAV